MTKCPFCAEEVTGDDAACPFCGEPTAAGRPDTSGPKAPEQGVAPPAAMAALQRLIRPALANKKVLAITGVALLAVLVLVSVGNSNDEESDILGDAVRGAVVETVASLETSLSTFNAEGGYRSMYAMHNQNFGQGRCWGAFSADFPDRPLITLIWPNGIWWQFSPGAEYPGGGDFQHSRHGSDFRLAGIDPAAFDLQFFRCEIDEQGEIHFPAT